MLFGMSYYEICWYFCFFSFAGWVVEVAFHAVSLGKIINRGFLNGPVCPVYGFGVLTVFSMVNLADSHLTLSLRKDTTGVLSNLILFLASMVLATFVELFAGWLLDICFHMRWWDYRNRPLNFHGYICLSFSIIWGAAITLVVRLVWPFLETHTTDLVPERYGWPVLGVFCVLYLTDLVITVATVIGLNRKLRELDRISQSMRTVSDRLSDTIGSSTLRTAQAIEEGQVQAALAKAELMDAARATRDTAAAAARKTMDTAAAAATSAKDTAAAAATSVKDTAAAAARKTRDTAAAAATSAKGTAAAAARKTRDTAAAAATSAKGTAAAAARRTMDTAASLAARGEAIRASLTVRGLFSPRRLLRAFPDAVHRDYHEQLMQLKKRLDISDDEASDKGGRS